MRAKAEREYWPVAVAYKAAELIARQQYKRELGLTFADALED
jgi:hypothetical protein